MRALKLNKSLKNNLKNFDGMSKQGQTNHGLRKEVHIQQRNTVGSHPDTAYRKRPIEQAHRRGNVGPLCLATSDTVSSHPSKVLKYVTAGNGP